MIPQIHACSVPYTSRAWEKGTLSWERREEKSGGRDSDAIQLDADCGISLRLRNAITHATRISYSYDHISVGFDLGLKKKLLTPKIEWEISLFLFHTKQDILVSYSWSLSDRASQRSQSIAIDGALEPQQPHHCIVVWSKDLFFILVAGSPF